MDCPVLTGPLATWAKDILLVAHTFSNYSIELKDLITIYNSTNIIIIIINYLYEYFIV